MTVEMSKLIAAAERAKAKDIFNFFNSERSIKKAGGLENAIRTLVINVGRVRTVFMDDELDALVAGRDSEESIEIV